MIDARSVILDLLDRGHGVRFQARGDSMHPHICEDEYVHVEPVPRDAITPGAVVLMDADRGLTVHRVVRIKGDIVIARGDNAPADDPPLHISRVRGVVTHVEHRDGWKGRLRRWLRR